MSEKFNPNDVIEYRDRKDLENLEKEAHDEDYARGLYEKYLNHKKDPNNNPPLSQNEFILLSREVQKDMEYNKAVERKAMNQEEREAAERADRIAEIENQGSRPPLGG